MDGLQDRIGYGRIGGLHCAASPQIGRISRALTPNWKNIFRHRQHDRIRI
jgi:hypothetical protein